jgi:hypothetical protein
MDPDDVAYKKSVRNMSVVLAAIVITIFAALFIPPYVFPAHDTFQSSATVNSAFGFSLNLQINATHLPPGDELSISGWLNNTSSQIDNVSAADSWGVSQGMLWPGSCAEGWPIGLGVMEGHYTQDNYTLGTLIPVPLPVCPVSVGTPSYILLEAHSSRALVDLGGTPQFWTIQSNYTFAYSPGEGLPGGGATGQLPAGVYTVVLADEWGDVLTTNFLVS